MRLDFNAFKMIKPDGAKDDYISGLDTKSDVERGKIHRERILNLLDNSGFMTCSDIAKKLNIPKRSVAAIIQRLVLYGRVTKGDKDAGLHRRRAYTYGINTMCQVKKSKIYKEKIMSFISDKGACTVQQIARAFDIGPSTVHNIIVRLEASGHIVKKGVVRGAGTKPAYTFAVNED